MKSLISIIIAALLVTSTVFARGGGFSGGSRGGGFSSGRSSGSSGRSSGGGFSSGRSSGGASKSSGTSSNRGSGFGKSGSSGTSTRGSGFGHTSISHSYGYSSKQSTAIYIMRPSYGYSNGYGYYHQNTGWGFLDYYIMYHLLFAHNNQQVQYYGGQTPACRIDRDCLTREFCDARQHTCVNRTQGW